MKKLRIGYYPLSADLSHPGDRRRVVFWAKSRGHQILTNPTEEVDVIVACERTDMQRIRKRHKDVPVILDLIDGYLAKESFLTDYSRGLSKVLTRQLHGIPKRYTRYTAESCSHASAVICSTREQERTIAPFCANVHVILDSHDEFPLLAFRQHKNSSLSSYQVIWEGMPYTLGGIRQAISAIPAHVNNLPLHLKVVTDMHYYKYLGKYLEKRTIDLLQEEIGVLASTGALVPWSQENLVSTAKESTLAIIPINLVSPLQFLKPENRLLIMWRLGLPCLTSATPAYIRVAKDSGVDAICSSSTDWKNKSQKLLIDPEAAEDVVTKGQEYLQTFHNAEVLLEKWDKAIGSVT